MRFQVLKKTLNFVQKSEECQPGCPMAPLQSALINSWWCGRLLDLWRERDAIKQFIIYQQIPHDGPQYLWFCVYIFTVRKFIL